MHNSRGCHLHAVYVSIDSIYQSWSNTTLRPWMEKFKEVLLACRVYPTSDKYGTSLKEKVLHTNGIVHFPDNQGKPHFTRCDSAMRQAMCQRRISSLRPSLPRMRNTIRGTELCHSLCLNYLEMEVQAYSYEVPLGGRKGLGLLFTLSYLLQNRKRKTHIIVTTTIYQALRIGTFLQILSHLQYCCKAEIIAIMYQ